MYQVVEYNDYRKENYIFLHGVTSDLEKAKQRTYEIIQKDIEKCNDKDNESIIYQVYKLDERANYVDLQPNDRKNVICEHSYRCINFSSLLGKTVREVFGMMEEKVPKKVSPNEIVTKDVFRNLIDNKHISIYWAEELGFDVDNYATIVAIVKCDEF